MTMLEMQEYICTNFVRNEMKLDLLSRKQTRIAYLIPVIILRGIPWNFLIRTPVKIEFIRTRRELFFNAPGLSRHNHVIVVENSWLVQQFVDKIAGLVLPENQSYYIHGRNIFSI
jgi:hypothetical protein